MVNEPSVFESLKFYCILLCVNGITVLLFYFSVRSNVNRHFSMSAFLNDGRFSYQQCLLINQISTWALRKGSTSVLGVQDNVVNCLIKTDILTLSPYLPQHF